MAFFGFFFWIITARLFRPEQIGLATTLISIVSLISSFSLLGLTAGLIRYLPASIQKNLKINTSFTLVALSTVVLSIIYLIGIESFSPKLQFIKQNSLFSILFVLIMVISSLNTIIDTVLIAYRSTKYVLIKNIVLSITKISLPFFLIALGAFGIFIAFGASTLIASLLGLAILIIKFNFVFKPIISMDVVRKMTRFSFGNYVSGFISQLPLSVLPVLITNKINPSTSAYFYVGLMIANLLYVIPTATSQSLFAEGSYSEPELRSHLKKAILIISFLMIPAIIIAVLFGNYILLAFGKEYASESFTFLRLIALSGIFIAVNSIGNTLLNIKHKVHYNILLNTITAVITLALSYLLISQHLIGIGTAWMIGNAITAGLYLLFLKKFL